MEEQNVSHGIRERERILELKDDPWPGSQRTSVPLLQGIKILPTVFLTVFRKEH